MNSIDTFNLTWFRLFWVFEAMRLCQHATPEQMPQHYSFAAATLEINLRRHVWDKFKKD